MTTKKLELKEKRIPSIEVDYETTKRYRTNRIDKENYTEDTLVPITKDTMFKAMLASTIRKKYLSRLLSYIFDLSEKEIYENFEYINSELDREFMLQKGERVDLVGRLCGVLINIEMNGTPLLDRNIKYLERISREKVLINSKTNNKGIKAIQINLNDVSYYKDEIVNYFYMNDGERAIGDKVLVSISLPLIRKKMYTLGSGSLEGIERFMAVSTTTNKKKAEEIAGSDSLMKEYIEEAKQVEECVLPYYPDLDVKNMDFSYFYKNLGKVEGREEGREEGKLEGLAKGRIEGLEEGFAKGCELGREEERAKLIESLKKIYNNGKPIENILECFNLSEDEKDSILQ